MNSFVRCFNHLHICALVLIGLTVITPAFAASITVVNEKASGPGSLRQAVLDLNANGNPGEVDTITFDARVKVIKQSDLAEADGLLGPIQITESLSITGTGPKNLTIDGGYSWITSDGVLNGGFPDHSTSSILVPSDVLFEVGRRHEDNSAIQFEISSLTVFRTAGLLEARKNAQVTVDEIVISENAFPLRTNTGGFIIGAAGPMGSLVIRNTEISGAKWDSSMIFSDTALTLIDNTLMEANDNDNTPDYGGIFTAGARTEIINSAILDSDVTHVFVGANTYLVNTVFRRTEREITALITNNAGHLHLNNVTVYATTVESFRSGQPSHLWISGGSLSMANTVLETESGPFPFTVVNMVRLEAGTNLVLNTHNHVSDGSLPGAATGSAGMEGPFIQPHSFKPTTDSPLIDSGSNAHAINPHTGAALTTDVLDFDRISGPNVDIGAVEVQENHAVNDLYPTKQDTPLEVPQPGLLINDQWSGTLVFFNDGLLPATHPQHGSITFENRQGGFLYVPNPGFHGTDTFTYRFASKLFDGSNVISNLATVTITVSPAPPGTIIVEMETSPAGATQSFDFTLTGGPDSVNEAFSLTDTAPPHASDLPAGGYVLTQTPVGGWAMHGFCEDSGGAVYPLDAIQVIPGNLVLCTVLNVGTDSIVVELLTSPHGGTGFGFTHDIGAGTPFTLDHKQTEHFDKIAPGTYTITQDDPGPDYYLAGIICVGAASQVEDVAQRQVTVTMGAEQTAHCSFINGERGRIIVNKETNPDGDPQAFNFDLTGPDAFAQNFDLTDGQTHDSGFINLGTYSLAETTPAGWEQSKAVCDDGSDPASISVSAGEIVTCTITNTEFDSVVVELLTTPGGGTGFGFTHDIGAGTPFTLDDTQSEHFDAVVAGSYSITQDDPLPLGYVLTAINCQGTYTNLVVDVGARQASFTMAAGQTAHCNFVNEEEGQIIVNLVTNPSGGPQTFGFALFGPDNVSRSFNLTDAQTPFTSGDIRAGSYHISSDVPDGWQLDGIACDDGSLHGDVVLQAGETVTCTVTESLIPAPSFTITKTPDRNPVQRGEQLEYTIAWENTGDGDAVGSILSDALPAGTTFISASGGGVYDAGSNSVSWSLGTIAANSGLQNVRLVLRVSPIATIIDNVAVLSFNQDRMVVASSKVQVEGMVAIPSLNIAGLLGLALLLLSVGLIGFRHKPRRD